MNINKIFYILFYTKSLSPMYVVFYTYIASQLRVAMFQVLNSCMWPSHWTV